MRMVKGAKGHRAILKGFVHYPEKGSRKGFYLLPAGRLIAEYLANEKVINQQIIRKAAKHLVARNVTAKSPRSHRDVTAMSPSCHRFVTAYPNTLVPCNPENPISLQPADTNEMSSSNFKFMAPKEVAEQSKPKECERCGKKVSVTVKFKLPIVKRELLELAPQAARYNCSQVCDACERELRAQALEALKALGYGTTSGEVGRDAK
jgi:hypothetical protein